MSDRVAGALSTTIKLDTTEAANNARSLRTEVRQLTSEWKAQEAGLKANGDSLAAAEAKMKGLTAASDKQIDYIRSLKIEQNSYNDGTENGVKKMAQLQTAIEKATTTYYKQAQQLEKATSSLNYYKSGLADLNRTMKEEKQVSESYVARLEAEGKTHEANKAKIEQNRSSMAKLTEVYKIQKAELDRMTASDNVSSDALAKQKARVNETAAAFADSSRKIKELSIANANADPFGTSRMGQSLNAVNKHVEKLGEKSAIVFDNIKSHALGASLAVAGIGAVAVKGAEQASELQKIYVENNNLLVTSGENAAEAQKNVNKMQQDGKKFSVEYGVSQKEIADGYQELIKRGYSSEQSLGAMESILQASIAAGDDFSETMSNSTATLESFGMQSKSVEGMTKNTKETVNNMAFAADMTATDFHSLGKAMEYAGSSAHVSGISMAETSAAIGILSNNGLEADKAGTGLRKVINSLQTPGADATVAMNELGISVKDFVDKSGKMKSITDILHILQDHMKGLNQFGKGTLFHLLFGTTGQQAGSILTANADKLGELTEQVKKSADGQGYVASLSKKNMSSVKNELNQFKEAAHAAEIEVGQKMLPVISDAATNMVKAFDSKEGQKGLEALANGVADLFTGVENGVKFLGEHQGEVKAFAGVMAGLWALNKTAKFIGMLRTIKSTMTEIAAIDAVGGLLGGGVKGGKKLKAGGAVTAVEEVASSIPVVAGKGGAAVKEVETVAAKSGALAKVLPVVGKSVPVLGTLAYAGSELLGSGSKTGNVGAAGGILAGAAGGAALGSIIPGAGTLAGAILGGIGSIAGGKLGRMAGDSQRVKDIVQDVKMNFDHKEFDKQQQTFRSQFDKSMKEFNQNSKIKLGSDPKANADAKKQSEKLYDDLSQDILNYYNKKAKTQDKDLSLLQKNGVLTQKQVESITNKSRAEDSKKQSSQFKTLNAMQDNSNRYWKQVQDLQTKGSKKLNDIAKQYEKEGGTNSKEYKKELNKELNDLQTKFNKSQTKLQQQLNDKITDETKIASGKQTDILATLKDKKVKLSNQEMKQMLKNSQKETDTIVKNANATYEKAKKAADKKYKETTDAADKEYYVNKSISEKQYKAIVKKAQDQRDSVVKSATEQKNKATDQTKQQNKAVQNEVEKQRAAVVKKAHEQMLGSSDEAQKQHDAVIKKFTKQKTDAVTIFEAQKKAHEKSVSQESDDVVKTWGFHNVKVAKKFDKNSEGINKVLNGMNKGSGTIPYIGLNGSYATGTKGTLTDETALVGEEGFELAHHANGGIFPIGINGPEIRKLQAGTSILPHDMSKQFMSMVSKLPAHKDGVVGTIDDLFSLVKKGGNWLEDSAEDVMKFVDKGAKSVFSMIAKSTGLDKAPKEDYNTGAYQVYSTESTDKGSVGVTDLMKSVFDKFKHQYEAEGGGGRGAPSGAGVQRWKSQVKAALKANGLSTSQSMVDRILRQIATESGGNEKAIQGNIGDINNVTGNLAQGLMQVIPPTFNAYKFPGHNNPFNGYDSLLAGLNYAKHTYGPSLSFLGNGHGYADGGLITQHGMYEVGEGNMPEMIIPLAQAKRSRAISLLNKVNSKFASEDPNSNINAMAPTDLTSVLSKIDEVSRSLQTVVQAIYDTALDGKDVYNAVNKTARQVNNLKQFAKG